MSAEPQFPSTRSDLRRAPEELSEEPADIAADLEEDGRRQRELDEAELGGEA